MQHQEYLLLEHRQRLHTFAGVSVPGQVPTAPPPLNEGVQVTFKHYLVVCFIPDAITSALSVQATLIAAMNVPKRGTVSS